MKIQLRNDTTSNWESYNPILAPGEIGVDTSLGKIKVGDGSTSWLNLPYIGSIDLSNYVDKTSSQTITGAKTFSFLKANTLFNNTSDPILANVGNSTDLYGNANIRLHTSALQQISGNNTYKILTDNDIATTSTKGIVQPDGTTITINNGVISSVGGGGGSTYTAGNGIDITNDKISIDDTVVPTLSGDNTFDGINSFIGQLRGQLRDTNGRYVIFRNGNTIYIGDNSSTDIDIQRNNVHYTNIDSGNISTYLPTATDSSKGLIQPDNTTINVDNNGVISVSNVLKDIPLGASRYSGDPLEANAGWLASNGQWNTKALYPSFYSKALAKIGDSFASGSIVDSTNSYTDYDLVINQTDETFRLPLLDGSESLVGDTYENITVQASGTTYTAPKNGLLVVHGSSTATNGNIHLYNTTANWAGTCQRPTLSGEAMLLYLPVRKGDVVQIDYSNATIGYCIWQFAIGNGNLYFKVANSVENLDLVDVGELTNDLANKVDIDGLNFTNTGKVELSSYGMPSNTLINLSLGVSGSSYTAPANGYLVMSFSGTANSAYAEILCYTGNSPQQNVTSNASTTLSGGWGRLMCPCKAGDVFNVYYGGGNFTVHNFEFVYAVGSESEAN